MGMKYAPGTFTVFSAFVKWALAHQDGTPMEVNPTTPNYNGNIFIASRTERLNCPEYLVLHSEDSQACCKLPFRKMCPDGTYGWYIEMTSGRYAFLMPAKSFDVERDRLNAGAHYDNGMDEPEPIVESRQMELPLTCKCKLSMVAIGHQNCLRCNKEIAR
jgi:hypothetical protein